MKKLTILPAFLLMVSMVKAQYISFDNQELKQLKTLIATDKRVSDVFDGFLKTASAALNEKPDPVEMVTSEGLLAGNPAKAASLKAIRDAVKIYSLCLVYRLYGNHFYKDKALEFLTAWAKINKATGDPIDETKFEDFITGYDLIRQELTQKQRAETDLWLGNILEAEKNSKYAKPGRGTAVNNWNSHRIKIMTFIAFALHKSEYDAVIKQELEKQLGFNLYPDGSSYDFEERDALHYHIYTLEPLLKTAVAISRAGGRNYYNFESATKSSIEKSVVFLVPFVNGNKIHPEFLNSKMAFDKARAANNEKEYQAGADFVPRKGLVVLSLAAYFDPEYLTLIRKVGAGEKQYLDWQLVLNRVRKPYRPMH